MFLLTTLVSSTKIEDNAEACKVESIWKDSLDLIPSPLCALEIQIRGGKVCLRCKGKTLLGSVNKQQTFENKKFAGNA